jgi:hypothetical protein
LSASADWLGQPPAMEMTLEPPMLSLVMQSGSAFPHF